MKQKVEKTFFVFQIIAFELGVANPCNVLQDTWNRQAMCQQIHKRFQRTLGETFYKSTSLRKLKKDDKSAVMEILQLFATLSHVDCQSVF